MVIMSNLRNEQKNLKKDEILQAVVIAEDFKHIFADFTESGNSALLSVANIHAIDYTLECLGRCGFQEIILFCSRNAHVLTDYIKKSPWSQASSQTKITLFVSEKCESLGDALRDIDNKAIIKGNFVLLSAFTISNLNLLNILSYHRQISLKDKGTAMTLILQDVGLDVSKGSDSIYVMNGVTNRLLMHVKSSELKKFEIPLDYLLQNINVNIYTTLMDTGIAICSPSVPILFSDNFDFLTKEDFIRGLLINEEILDSRIYCYQVINGYGATINNWQSFQKVTMDCIHRWTFPLVPDQIFNIENRFVYHRNCIYKQNEVQLINSVELNEDVIIGEKSRICHNSKILRSVVGKNCQIGQNVVIRDSFIYENSTIGNNCVLELCVVGENSKIKDNSVFKKCFLKTGVSLDLESKFEEVLISNKSEGRSWIKHSTNVYFLKLKTDFNSSDDDLNYKLGFDLIDPEEINDEVFEDDDVSSVSNDENSYVQSPEPDDTMLFYSEVVDSLHRGFEEKLSCENLILEINSSRYAYNVSLSDVTLLTLKGILLLPSKVKSTVKEVLTYFLLLLKNYIKTSEAQIHCLELIEEVCTELGNETAICLHYLYDNDIISEDNILDWHANLGENSPVLPKISSLIKWLNEAAEESSSEETE